MGRECGRVKDAGGQAPIYRERRGEGCAFYKRGKLWGEISSYLIYLHPQFSSRPARFAFLEPEFLT